MGYTFNIVEILKFFLKIIFINLKILRLLMYASLVMPFNIAFVPNENLGWEIWNYMVDGFFFIDLIINIFTAY